MNEILDQYFDVGLMADNFDAVLEGFWITIQLSVIAGALALLWGLVLAVLRQLPGRPLLPVRLASVAYIDVFRGVPLLIVILLISGSLPFLPLPEAVRIPRWFGKPDPFWYGVMALTITYGAYMAEVYRAGIEAVPAGQTVRHVILPQAIRKVFAPLLNDFIALMKDTTLVSVIALNEVALVGRDIQSSDFNSSALTLGALMFLVVTLPLARLVDRLIAREKGRFSRTSPRGAA